LLFALVVIQYFGVRGYGEVIGPSFKASQPWLTELG
jgi:hypothetical protein